MNFTELKGNELIVSWYKQGGVKDKVSGNVFVKGLSADTKSKDLHAFFSAFGNVFSCRVKYAPNGKCKGYGYVQFETKEIAQKVISEANDKAFKGSKISISPFLSRENRSSSFNIQNNLFVKNIPKSYTNEDLKRLFAGYGEILSAVAIKETMDAKENKGFGFICFKNQADAKKAEEKMKNTQVEGQMLYICQALSKIERKKQLREERLKIFKDCNLYVKELPETVDDEKLKKGFEEFGKVVSAKVMMARKQEEDKVVFVSKKFGFVCFSKKEEAKEAIAGSAKKQILDAMLYVAIAEKKEERRARLNRTMMSYPMPMSMYGFPPPMPFGSRPPFAFLFQRITFCREAVVDKEEEVLEEDLKECIQPCGQCPL